jgi:hypothetical protein
MKLTIGTILATGLFVNTAMCAAWPPSVNSEPIRRVEESTNVAWLERIAQSLDNAQELGPRGGLGGHARDLRTAAYARLGTLATPESLAAVERIEQQARGESLTPRTIPLGVQTHPCWHFSDPEIRPLAQARASDGRTYAVLTSSLLGSQDLFLISTTTPDDPVSWSRPVLVPDQGRIYTSIKQPQLKVASDGLLEFTYIHDPKLTREYIERTQASGKTLPKPGDQRVEIRLADVLRDTDQDGWTDIEEQRLGLDPNKADTDGDGLADGMDPCPNYAPTNADASKENSIILQKAVFATFGLSGSRYLLIVGPSAERGVDPTTQKIQAWGYPGPIIYREDSGDSWRKAHGFGGVFVSWRVARTGDEAKVTILDYEGSEAAGSQYVLLKKISGKWTVVGRQFGFVS